MIRIVKYIVNTEYVCTLPCTTAFYVARVSLSIYPSLSFLLAHGVARICCLYFPIETFFSLYIIDFQQHEPETASKNNKHEYHYGH